MRVFPFQPVCKERLVSTVKKIIAMLLMAAFLFTGAVGCEGEKKPEKDKAPAKDAGKDKK
jgi:hypothetical protein